MITIDSKGFVQCLLPIYLNVFVLSLNTFVIIYSNTFEGSARPIRDFFLYYAISAAYNSNIYYVMGVSRNAAPKNDVILRKTSITFAQ